MLEASCQACHMSFCKDSFDRMRLRMRKRDVHFNATLSEVQTSVAGVRFLLMHGKPPGKEHTSTP